MVDNAVEASKLVRAVEDSGEEDEYINDKGGEEMMMAKCDPVLGCEADASMMIFYSLLLIVLSIFLLYTLLIHKVQSLPESTATIFLGMTVGLIIRLNGMTLSEIFSFNPETFFLYLLPTIIFESGYSLHKGKVNHTHDDSMA